MDANTPALGEPRGLPAGPRPQRWWGVRGSGSEPGNCIFWFFIVLIYLIPTSKMYFYKKKKRLERSDEVSLKIVVTCSLII